MAEVDLLLGLLVPGRLDHAIEVVPVLVELRSLREPRTPPRRRARGPRRRGSPSLTSSGVGSFMPSHTKPIPVLDALSRALEAQRRLVLALAVLVVGAVDDHGSIAGGCPRLPSSAPGPPFLRRPPCGAVRLFPTDARRAAGCQDQGIRRPVDTGDVWTGRGARRSLTALTGIGALVALLGVAGSAAAAPPRIGGCQVFPPFAGSATAPSAADQTAWNQDVSEAPVAARSRAYVNRITALGGNQVVHPDFGGNGAYGIPYTTVGPNQPRVRVKVIGYPDESDFGLAPIPANAPVEGGSDRHVLVLQRQRCLLFELFAAHYVGGSGHRWTASSTARFNLGSRTAASRGLDVSRCGGASDPARARALRRGRRGSRPPRDPRHLLGDAPRLHPPRHPLRLRPLRPQPAPDGTAAAALDASTSTTTSADSRRAASRG